MGEWNWAIAPGAIDLAAPLKGHESLWFPPDAKGAFKDNNARTLFLWKGLFCKFFKGRVDNAEAEFRALVHLGAAGIPVPRPVAWSPAPGGAVLATVEIHAARPIKDAWRRDRIGDLADLVRRMHRAGYLHLDLHTGNVLVTEGGLVLTDLHRGKIGPVSERSEERAVGQLAYSITRAGTLTDVLRFIRLYRGRPDAAFRDRVIAHADAFRRRHLASRTRRCLKNSTSFQVSREPDGLFFTHRPFSPAQVRGLLELHDSVCAKGRAAKDLGGRRISIENGFVVKEWKTTGPFRALRNWVRGTPARAAWIAAQGLAVRGLPAPEGVALVESRGRSFFVARVHPGTPLDRYAREDAPRLKDRRPFLDALAARIRRLHVQGAHHRDLKANNILADGPTRFAFLDLEDVEFRRLRRSDVLRALAQLNAALPFFTRADRWRMLRRYSAANPVLGDLRAAAREIMKRTIARKHNWPTSR